MSVFVAFHPHNITFFGFLGAYPPDPHLSCAPGSRWVTSVSPDTLLVPLPNQNPGFVPGCYWNTTTAAAAAAAATTTTTTTTTTLQYFSLAVIDQISFRQIQ